MQIKPMFLQDLDGTSPLVLATKPAKQFLPGGRSKGEEPPPPPPPPPSYNDDQLKAAERDSYKKGFTDGIDDGKRQSENEQARINNSLTQMLAKFTASIEPVLQDYISVSRQLQQDVPRVALAIAKKVAGDALDGNAQAVVDDIAKRCVETMIGEPKLQVSVNPKLAPTLESKIKSVVAGGQNSCEVTVVGDESLLVSDCRIEWKHGSFVRHTGQLWEEIARVVGNMGATAEFQAETRVSALKELLSKATEITKDKKE